MTRPHVATAAELTTLRDLELVTRQTVEGLRHGLHRSPFHGYSAEFSQYRQYRPGDDLRHVDWKRFAKSDRLYTRQFRETSNLSALFVVDISRSMDFDGKFALARRVTAVLATLILDQGDAAGLLALGGATFYVPPRGGSRHLRLLLQEIARLAPAGITPMASALNRAGALLSRRGLLVAISDLYDEGTIGALRRLARMGHEVIVVQTLAADEMDLPRVGAAEFVDAETGQRVVVQTGVSATAYAARVRAWLSDTEREVRREGFDYLRITTADDLERALRRFLLARSRSA